MFIGSVAVLQNGHKKIIPSSRINPIYVLRDIWQGRLIYT